jgi:poly(3-hydroxybutyrate) depolymerase
MKLFTAAAIAIVLSSGVAFAQQDNNATSSTNGGGNADGGANYLTGPKTQTLFTDESRSTVRPPAEFKEAWDKLNPADQEDIRQACSANRDVSYNPLCTNAKAM